MNSKVKYSLFVAVFVLGIAFGCFYTEFKYRYYSVYVTSYVRAEESLLRHFVWLSKYLEEDKIAEAKDLIDKSVKIKIEESNTLLGVPAAGFAIDLLGRTVALAKCLENGKEISSEELPDLMANKMELGMCSSLAVAE